MPRSRLSLTVVSVHERAGLLEVLLDLRVLVLDLERDLVAAVADAGLEAARAGRAHGAGEDDRHLVGPGEPELVAGHALEPVAAGLGTVEDARVGELEPAQRQPVAVAAAPVGVCERRRRQPLPATAERPDPARAQPGADRGERVGVSGRAKAVVERRKRAAPLVRLPLRPLVPVEAEPERVGPIAAALPERRPPLALLDREVAVVGQRRPTRELEMGRPGRAAAAPAGPDPRPLLHDADHQATETALTSGRLQARTRDPLPRLAAPETNDRDRVSPGEALDRSDRTAADLTKQHRRGNDRAAVEHEAHKQPLAQQPRHTRPQLDPVDRAHPKRHTVAQ
jgi:hypothetical protein